MLLTLTGIILDGKTADGEVGVAAGSDVSEGNTLGERITGLESRHVVGIVCFFGSLKFVRNEFVSFSEKTRCVNVLVMELKA